MTNRANRFSRTCRHAASAALALAIVLVPGLVAPRSAQAQTFTVLHTFTNSPDGDTPIGGLILDKVGNLYGTTLYGGTAGGFGTVFKLDTTGKLTLQYSFAGTPDAENPTASLRRDAAGNLYGTTQYGGTNGGYGTVFKLDTTGKLTLLHSFAGYPNGAKPYSGLIRDLAGNLYGTTLNGGTVGYGAVFKLDTAGNLTVLHSFTNSPDGATPVGGLIPDAAGNLYGTTLHGGTSGVFGSVFKLDTTGTLTLLHSFGGLPDGENPQSSLLRDAAGNLYGTTQYGGANGCCFGTVFKLDTTGTLKVLHSFAGTPDGQNPFSRLVRDSAGNFYGTTFYGGTYGFGTVFKLDTSDKLTVLHSFNNSPDGSTPIAGLILDKAGNLYGTTVGGGDLSCGFGGCGTVFKLTP